MLRQLQTSVVHVLLFLITAFSSNVSAAKQNTSYTFGIAPQQSASELAKRWIPILEYIGRNTGVILQFSTEKDIPTYQNNLNLGKFDFSFINPFHYTIANKNGGYLAFAKERGGKLEGIIVVNLSSNIRSIADLNGKTLAFPSPNALGATWLPTRLLNSRNITFNAEYVNSIDSVYRSVAKGIFSAGGGEMRTFSTIDPEIKNQLQIIWTSAPLPPFVFCVHPRVPTDLAEQVARVMIDMDKDPVAAELLKAIHFPGIERASDQDFDEIRKMKFPNSLPGK